MAIPLPKCWLYEMTGLYCPGCGATRATLALAHGHYASAFSFNWMFFPIVSLIVIYFAWTALHAFNQRLVPSPIAVGRMHKVFPVVAIAFVIFGVLRNIPGLEVLAPHATLG